jgi:hypothetical protein
MVSDAIRNGCGTVADMPVKHFDMQAAMKTHLSQSTGAGAFDGQHGISSAIPSIEAAADTSSAIACIEAWEDVSAITGRETGAKARPAIIQIASSRRMAKLSFTTLISHKAEARKSHPIIGNSVCPVLIGIKLPAGVSAQITDQTD